MARGKAVAMQRAASLAQLPSLLDEFGVDVAAVLPGTGVSQDALRPDAFIPYAAFVAILDNACRLTGRDDVGMLLGRRQTLAALGPLGDAMRHAATLGEAVATFAALQSANSTGGAVYLMRAERDVVLGYGVYDAEAGVSAQIYDLVLAVGCNLVAELTDGQEGPDEILVSRAAPDDPGRYLRLARCPVRFGQSQTGLVIRPSALARPLPAANRDLHEQALARLPLEPGTASLGCCGRVRRLLRPLLLEGRAGMEQVAGRLGLHPRALRRRLREEGATFEALKDEVRRTAACEMLLLGGLSVADISATLDYATPSAFAHAFGRWTGQPPGRWRAARLGVRQMED